MMGESYSAEYRSFLLRLWRNNAQQPWRISATDTRNGRTFYFASITEFASFLESNDTSSPASPTAPSPQP